MRKTIDITIAEDNRDKGKTFLITEMPASKAEKWAIRALLAVAKSGVELPENVEGAGMAGIAVLGVKALMSLRYEDAEPLLDEMFECVQIKPDRKNPNVVRFLVEDDIEEIATRIKLRTEALRLHVDFSLAGIVSK